MQLKSEEAQQFFKIYFSLLAFVARQTDPNTKTRQPEDIKELRPSQVGVIRVLEAEKYGFDI
jgi:hypothetical protein